MADLLAQADRKFDGDVAPDDTLEQLIARSSGDTSHTYRVLADGKVVGVLNMKALVPVLVPRLTSSQST